MGYYYNMGMTSTEAAEYLGVSRRFITDLCRRGKLSARKHGRDWDIDPESVKAYKEAPKDKGGRPRKTTTH